MTSPAPTGFPAVDTITIAGVPAPGRWWLVKGPKKFGWDERKGYGTTGATLVPTGDPLVEVTFSIYLWDDAQYPLFVAFDAQFLKKPAFSAPGGVATAAMGIDHPELKRLGVTSVVVLEKTPLVNDGYGGWTGEVTFKQYRPPKPALSKPDATIPDNGTPRPTAQDNQERELLQLSQQFQALAK